MLFEFKIGDRCGGGELLRCRRLGGPTRRRARSSSLQISSARSLVDQGADPPAAAMYSMIMALWTRVLKCFVPCAMFCANLDSRFVGEAQNADGARGGGTIGYYLVRCTFVRQMYGMECYRRGLSLRHPPLHSVLSVPAPSARASAHSAPQPPVPALLFRGDGSGGRDSATPA